VLGNSNQCGSALGIPDRLPKEIMKKVMKKDNYLTDLLGIFC
jgi:hypothetical protein